VAPDAAATRMRAAGRDAARESADTIAISLWEPRRESFDATAISLWEARRESFDATAISLWEARRESFDATATFLAEPRRESFDATATSLLALLLWREFAILYLAGGDIDDELGKLGGVARALGVLGRHASSQPDQSVSQV
jgi:hypothetical protein